MHESIGLRGLVTRNWQVWPLLLVTIFMIHVYYRRYRQNAHIARLGTTAPIVKTYLPFGIEFPFKAVSHFLRNRAMAAWLNEWAKLGCLDINNYTCELRILVDLRVIMTADPENIKAVLATQFNDYGKGEQFHKEWEDFLGDAIFVTDGKRWSEARALLRPFFERSRVADLEIIEEHVQEMLYHLGPGDGRTIDARNLMSRFSLDASTHFLFGQSAGSLVDERAEFGLAFDEVQRLQTLQGRAGPIGVFIPMHKFHQGLKTMDRFIEPYIAAALAMTPEELEGKLKQEETFLHALARHTRDRKVIRDQLVALLLAGRDTTSCVLSWMILELSRNPRVVRKIQQEINEVIGARHGRLPTYDQIKNMKYLNWTINETLRLYPVVPFNIRDSLTDTTLPRGGGPTGTEPIGIPKGTPIAFSTLIMQRRRDLYPPHSPNFPHDPEHWVPERWATWQPKPWQFIPFNGGPRICIGQQFALVETAYVIIRLLSEYDRIVDCGNDQIEFGINIVLSPYPGVKVGFVKDGKMGE